MGRVVEIGGCDWARCLLQPLVILTTGGSDSDAISTLVSDTEQFLNTYLPLTAAADPSQPATRLSGECDILLLILYHILYLSLPHVGRDLILPPPIL